MDIETANNIATIKGLEALFANVVSVMLGLAGIVLFVMLVIGGIKYIRSGADAAKAEASKQLLSSAVKWVFFIILALLVLVFIQQVTGVPITNFIVVQP
jgi:hypothetical protein